MSSGDYIYSNGQKPFNDPEKASKTDIQVLKLHRRPILTLYYALIQTIIYISELISYILSHRRTLALIIWTVCSISLLYQFDGVHKEYIVYILAKTYWWAWWVLLGILSSCGFGTGLHTFILYLGPFIAKVTMAAYECETINFLEPPYPNEFLCPDNNTKMNINMWTIIQKVLLESVLWGVGTAIGELPPYFMARGAAISNMKLGKSLNDINENNSNKSTRSRLEQFVEQLIHKAGFVGIMLCASVPNPLFDFAGFSCGHFLVPFSTFFGATLIGKAVNKMTIQMIFVILIFSKEEIAIFQSLIKQIPSIGASLNSIIEEFLVSQREKIHKAIVVEKQSWLQFCLSWIQFSIIAMFVISIINSFANTYQKRLLEWQHDFNQCIANKHYNNNHADSTSSTNNSSTHNSSSSKIINQTQVPHSKTKKIH